METTEKVAAVALGRVFGFTPKIALRLMQELGSAAAVFALSPKQRDMLLGPHSKFAGALSDALLYEAAKELENIQKQGCDFLPYTHPAFPQLLKESEDSPAGLYYKSTSTPEDIFTNRTFVSIVGTRDITPYGKEWCIKMVEALSQAPCKPTIVSGLALGVDITAHRAALRGSLPTIAVLPNGIESVYPYCHKDTAAVIVRSQGSALISDFPPGSSPAPFTFLRRNRIIAALSSATILVESRIHGGGVITARLANSYGREVFALPGRIDDEFSAGCNLLLRQKIAEAIVNLSELGRQLGLGNYSLRSKRGVLARVEQLYQHQTEDKRKLLMQCAQNIKAQRDLTTDDLCTLLGQPYSTVAEAIATLECDSIIETDLLGRCNIKISI